MTGDADRMNSPAATTRKGSAGQGLRSAILRYLRQHHTMTIASSQHDRPWAATVFYASDDLDLYFLSNPQSRHGTNMKANSRVSVAINGSERDWRKIRGIQLEGHGRPLRSEDERARFWTAYRKKFPFVEHFLKTGMASRTLRPKLSRIRLYQIAPDRIWWIDNRLGFGHRECLDLVSVPPQRQRSR